MLQVLRRLAPLALVLGLALAPAPHSALAASPDFSISASPSSVLLSSNGSSGFASTTVSATALNGFTGFVSFSVSGLPAGVTANVIPAPGPNVASVQLNASAAARQGTTNITVTGTSGSLTHSIQVPLTVVLPVSDFAVFVNPTSATISAGASGTFNVGGTPLTGFTGTVTFTASGLPAGVTASFSPTVMSSNGASSTTLTLAAASGASASTSTVVVTGHAGSVTATASIALTVAVSGPPTTGVVISPAINANSPWFDEDDVKISNPVPLTSLSVTIVIQRTTGVSFGGQYNTVGGQIVQSSSSTATAITYQFTLAAGQTLAPGSGWTFGAQASGSGTFHPTAGDSFAVTYATPGAGPFTQSGNYPEIDPLP